MKVLLVGVGGVGEAIAVMADKHPWLEKMVLADYNKARAEEVQARSMTQHTSRRNSWTRATVR